MNFELVPCCIKDCEEVGRYSVSSGRGTIQVCATHALEMAKLQEQAKKEMHHAPD